MEYLIIGNIISLVASILMIYSGTLKKKDKILFYLTVQTGLSVIANIFLSGITGAIINAISMVRNWIGYKDKLNLKVKIIITIVSISFCLKFNNLGLIGLLPMISTLIYLYLMNIKDIKKFKLLIAFTTFLWLIYDFIIKAYTSVIFDIVYIITNIVVIFKIRNKG